MLAASVTAAASAAARHSATRGALFTSSLVAQRALLSTSPTVLSSAASGGAGDGKDGGAAAPPPPPPPTTSKPSIIKTILHGSQKAAVDETNTTFSKSLARGKYIHELQRHKIKPERVDEYVKLVSEIYPDVAQSLAPATKLCGSFMVQVGPDLDTAFHIWEYEGYSAHANRLKDSRVSEKLEKALRPLIVERESQIMLEFAFWPTSPPVDLGGVYELRSYTLRPGNLLEWEMNWRRGIECRRHLEHPIGAWFSQIGQLHQVHHLWAYPDLESRKIRREEAWKVDGWSQTVYNTVRLIDSMQNRILLPMKFSPLR